MGYGDKRKLSDGFTSSESGINSGIAPSLLGRNQQSFAVNTTFRTGFPETRPGVRQYSIQFENSEKRVWFEDHVPQGYYVYDPPNGVPVMVCSVGGRFFELRPSNGGANAIEFTPPDGRNSQIRPTVWFQQADDYLIAQDGSSKPIIYDGSVSRRSDPDAYEVPIGKQMAYGNWRLFVVLPDGRQILAGDFAQVTPTSVLEFTETTYLQSGGSLAIPTNAGDIRALFFTSVNNTIAGQGPLLACMPRTIVSFNPIPQRAQWEVMNPFSTIALINSGYESQSGTTIVNGDAWGRSFDGIRSFVMASREFGGWGNTPSSREMNRVLEGDTPSLLEFCSSIYFDNRLLMTCNPIALAPSGAYHRGIIALNFENVSSIGKQGGLTAAYDGLWTGIQPYQMVTGLLDGKQRAFALCRGVDDNKTQLWEITKDEPFDNGSCPIVSSIETPAFAFKYPAALKRLVDGELWADRLQGDVQFNIKFKADQNPCWTEWKVKNECAPVEFCDADFAPTASNPCPVFTEAKAQYRRLRFGSVPGENICDPVLNSPYTDGYDYQLRIEWTGHARLKRLVIHTVPIGDPVEGVC